jgi:hypothetical protein
MTCGLILLAGNANAIEVFYKKISNPFSEPTMMFLMGMGLIGLSIVGRRVFQVDKLRSV